MSEFLGTAVPLTSTGVGLATTQLESPRRSSGQFYKWKRPAAVFSRIGDR